MHRRRLPTLAASLLLAVLLSSCNLGALIPPVDVGDPLALDGQPVTADLREGPLETAAVSHGLHEKDGLTIDDVDLHGLSPRMFRVEAGFDPVVTLDGVADAAAAPESVTVSRVLFRATIGDESNGDATLERTLTPDATFVKDSCEDGACVYRYAGSDDPAALFDLEWTDAEELARLGTILSRAPSPNHGSVTIGVEVESDPGLGGLSATFTLVSDGTTIDL